MTNDEDEFDPELEEDLQRLEQWLEELKAARKREEKPQ